uniref:Transposase n=1 Tax=Bursaphelenchus xylophilus TaxID=6326 RepID=A0A1I7RKJ4_BURXY
MSQISTLEQITNLVSSDGLIGALQALGCLPKDPCCEKCGHIMVLRTRGRSMDKYEIFAIIRIPVVASLAKWNSPTISR